MQRPYHCRCVKEHVCQCAVTEVASDEPCNDSEHRASSRRPDGRAVTMLCSSITDVTHLALLRPARQCRTQELPRDVRQIVCLSLVCLARLIPATLQSP